MPAITQNKAEAINTTVRNFFKSGHKSANKLYFAASDALDTTVGKPGTRAANQALASTSIDASRAKSGALSAIAYGKMLWDSGVGDGNCWEQACLAAYWATYETFDFVWLGQIADPGDHVFCLIGSEGDMPHMSFKTAAQMGHSTMGAMVVDPWANTVCPVGDYPTAFLKKMKSWTAVNKRVSLRNKDFNGWLEPSNPLYVKGFLDGPLRFDFAKAARRMN